MWPEPVRHCILCGKDLHGRSDKKFCNPYCRSFYNNRVNLTSTHYVRNVINALRRNRRILEEILGKETCRHTSRERLVTSGFLFNYHTHTHTSPKGDMLQCCFELGYRCVNPEWIEVVKLQLI